MAELRVVRIAKTLTRFSFSVLVVNECREVTGQVR